MKASPLLSSPALSIPLDSSRRAPLCVPRVVLSRGHSPLRFPDGNALRRALHIPIASRRVAPRAAAAPPQLSPETRVEVKVKSESEMAALRRAAPRRSARVPHRCCFASAPVAFPTDRRRRIMVIDYDWGRVPSTFGTVHSIARALYGTSQLTENVAADDVGGGGPSIPLDAAVSVCRAALVSPTAPMFALST